MKQLSLKYDLNLLKILYVLLEEKSVKKAAERLFITPSAVSKALQRSRELFNDPLFVRSAGKLVPSQRASELETQLHQIFNQLDHCFSSSSFDPATIKGRVRIAAPEQFSFALVPKLLLRLRQAAPDLILDSQHLGDDYQRTLGAGLLDFAVHIGGPYPNDFTATHIYSAAPMFLSRKNHPLSQQTQIDYSDILSYPQIAFATQNMAQEDIRIITKKIEDLGLTVNTIFDTDHLLIALDVLMRTDALMLAPDYISLMPIFRDALRAHPVSHMPIYDNFHINVSLVQHARTVNSPLHQWVKDEIIDIFSSEINSTDEGFQ